MDRKSSITLQSECSESERATLRDILKKSNFSATHMEIGTAAGGTLKELIGCYPIGKAPKFVVIDPLSYFPNQLEKIKKNLASANIDSENVDFWQGTTETFINSNQAVDLELDFLFIDADHRHYPVLIDLAWAGKVNKGGYIGLHDDSPKFPGVGWAIRRFLSKNPNFQYISKTKTLVVIKKTDNASKVNITRWDLRVAAIRQLLSRLRMSIRKRILGSKY